MADPMRLLVLAQGYPCDANPMAGVYHRDQLRVIAKAGVDVTVVVPIPWVPPGLAARNGRWANYAALPASQRDGALTIYRPRYLALPRENRCGAPDLLQTLAVQRLLRRIGYGRPDAIHAFFALPTGAVARALARDWNVPYGVSLLGDDVNIYPQHNRRNLAVLRHVLADAAIRIANGPTLAATAERLTGVTVDCLSIGVSPERFDSLLDKAEARRRLGLPEGQPIALYAGALSVTKGIGELALAMDQVADTSLLAVTLGDGPLRADLERRANVICLGMRPATEVTIAMAAADLLVHPSYYEGLPTVLLEAALAGLPIVTTDAPGCLDLARDGRGWVVPVKDANALAQTLRQAVTDERTGRQQADAMAAHVRDQYLVTKNSLELVLRYGQAMSDQEGR